MAWQCRYCRKDLPNKALKCPSCGEWLINATYRWDYKHFYLPVVVAEASEASACYDEKAFAAELAKLGTEGWELASLVPKWRWEISRSAAQPAAIAGYYVTLKRRGARIYDIEEAEAIEHD
jgi:hypothetical protein